MIVDAKAELPIAFDVTYHTIRGLKKMKLMVILANIIMLVLAKAYICKEQKD